MMAGASQSTGSYRGNVTSYDYDAPLDEAGHPTAKFFAYRDVILKYTHAKQLPVPAVAPVIAIPKFALGGAVSLWSRLPAKPVKSEEPLTMEQVGQAYGYILYRTELKEAVHGEVLKLDHPYDYAQVYVDGEAGGDRGPALSSGFGDTDNERAGAAGYSGGEHGAVELDEVYAG